MFFLPAVTGNRTYPQYVIYHIGLIFSTSKTLKSSQRGAQQVKALAAKQMTWV